MRANIKTNEMSSLSQEDILTADEIVKILHINPNTLHSKRWRQGSNIPVFKQGQRLFAIKKSFWAWYKERMIF